MGNAVEDAAAEDRIEHIKVWDVPTRLFHWLLVVSFIGAWLTRTSERWHDVHMMFGHTVGGLILFRIVWGFAGSYYARFASFSCAPSSILSDLGRLLRGAPERHVGHSPAGAAMMLAFLALGIVIAGTGIVVARDWLGPAGSESLAGVHAFAADAMLVLVGVHVLAVVLTSILLREDLVRPMFNGRKTGRHSERIGRWRAGVGIALLMAVSGYWAADRSGLLGEDGKTRRPSVEQRAR